MNPTGERTVLLTMKKCLLILLPVLGIFSVVRVSAQQAEDVSLAQFHASGDNCTFKADPDAFLQQQARASHTLYRRMATFDQQSPSLKAADTPLVHKNFIDDEIFAAMDAAGIAPAPLSSDEEFLRRVTLDLTGRIPSSADVRAFVANPDPGKRSVVINNLLYTPAFTDKWTMWFGDLVENNASAVNVTRNISGRNALYKFLWLNVTDDRVSLKDTVYNLITSSGNNYDEPNASGYIMGAIAPGGPIQDEYDMLVYKTAKEFLGLGNYDCLLCHNGRGHLDSLNLWATGVTRTDAERMAAMLSHERRAGYTVTPTTPADTAAFYLGSNIVSEATSTTSSYALPTTFGNRPNRPLVNNKTTLDPVYRTGQAPATSNWRQDYAKYLVNDPMFSTNMVNRLWKQMFNYGLVDAVDALDPARLDPANPPADPWTFQATHPVLLQRLAKEFVNRNYSLRETLRLITESTAYQLSAQYPAGNWTQADIPYFARHYLRRLDGEEIHDAIAKATGIIPTYTVQGWAIPVNYAMQLPDTSEPRSNGTVANFMNAFLRGNRDNVPRSGSEAIAQSQSLMNDNFVISRVKMAASPTLQAVAKLATPSAQIDEMYYTFLGRLPSDYERSHAAAFLAKATTTAQKNTALEDFAWALINKLEFAFSH
jgi:Protein of unknown function (DUF1553)/Protein of unknown function (DUF1549)